MGLDQHKQTRSRQKIAPENMTLVAQVQHLHRSDTGERTHFVEDWCASVEEEALKHVQGIHAQIIEYTEPKSLSDGGLDAIEHRIRTGAFNPVCTAVRK